MLEKRKRISKKEIKQDTLVTSYYKAYNFFVENQVRILIGVGVVALIVVAAVLYGNKRASDGKIASTMLAQITPVYQSGQFKQAIEGMKETNVAGLKEIVEKYGGTEAGESAKIFLANAYYFTGNYDAALEEYEDYGGSIELFKATAKAGEAAYYEMKKEYEKAAELYKDAAKITSTNPANADYLLRAGINFMQVGNKEEAKNLFDTIIKDYKTSPAMQEVEKYLVQVQS